MLQARDVGEAQIELAHFVLFGEIQHFLRTHERIGSFASAGGDQLLTQAVFDFRRQFAAFISYVKNVHRPAPLRVHQDHVDVARRRREHRSQAVKKAGAVFRNDLHQSRRLAGA